MAGDQEYSEQFKELLTIQGTPLENTNRRAENPEKIKEPLLLSWLFDIFLALIVTLPLPVIFLNVIGSILNWFSLPMYIVYLLFYIFIVRLEGKATIIKAVILSAKVVAMFLLSVCILFLVILIGWH